MKLSRIPTGIDSLDYILQGGLPSGSLVLLLGELGAGDFEFAITSCVRLLSDQKKIDTTTLLPEKVIYISFTRSENDIMKEIAFSFPDFYEFLQNKIHEQKFEFKDFSDSYFAGSFIPASWLSSSETAPSIESLKWNEEKRNLMDALIVYLDKNAQNSLIIIDSLTSMAQYCLERIDWADLILFLRGLQRVSKNWNGLIYAIFNEGIFENKEQVEIMECMDGVFVFDWEQLGPTQRNRIMYLKKFRGLLPGVDHENIVNFETQITPQKGFEVSNIKRVRGR
ncbi:MAG: ATPase domain-containing protein [Candidatus Methanoperedens sp.]|nr:ATPase domain-containing protein [Candidatus Methanoperedens sp.]